MSLETSHTQPLIESELGSILNWYREGAVVYEALQRGMTVIMPEWNVGYRPIPQTMVQLVELARYLDSDNYVNEPFTTSSTGAPLRPSCLHHRRVLRRLRHALGGAIHALVVPWSLGRELQRRPPPALRVAGSSRVEHRIS